MRALGDVYRQLWLRRLPHGTLSWRFLLPGADSQLRLHRQWWLDSPSRLPQPLWLLLELTELMKLLSLMELMSELRRVGLAEAVHAGELTIRLLCKGLLLTEAGGLRERM